MNRTLEFLVDAALVAPQNYLLHRGSPAMWHEVILPDVFRVGVTDHVALIGSQPFEVSLAQLVNPAPQTYVIEGFAWELDGLRAPYEEQDASAAHTWRFETGDEPIAAWFAHANTDRYTALEAPIDKWEPEV
jgi:hypothetical protein